jgi:hypothetical protein
MADDRSAIVRADTANGRIHLDVPPITIAERSSTISENEQ